MRRWARLLAMCACWLLAAALSNCWEGGGGAVGGGAVGGGAVGGGAVGGGAVGGGAVGGGACGRPTLVLVDGVSTHVSDVVKDYCREHGIRLVDVVSPAMEAALVSRGHRLEDHIFSARVDAIEPLLDSLGDDADTWSLSESELGIETSQLIGALAGRQSPNAPAAELLDRLAVQRKVAARGLSTLQHSAARSWEDAYSALNALWLRGEHPSCVMKPRTARVLGEQVALCKSVPFARKAFAAQGGDVLLQELAEGTEYVVETVGSKVVALWRRSLASPLVVQQADLVIADTDEARQVCALCQAALISQPIERGPAHCVVRVDPLGRCVLVSLRATWASIDTTEACRLCLDNSPVTVSLDECFRPERFKGLPSVPAKLQCHARVVNLLQPQAGTVLEVRHLDLLRSLSSLRSLRLLRQPGDRIPRTVDASSIAGYAVLVHEDAATLESDSELLKSVQGQMFHIDPRADSYDEKDGDREPDLNDPRVLFLNEAALAGSGRRRRFLHALKSVVLVFGVAYVSSLAAALSAPLFARYLMQL